MLRGFVSFGALFAATTSVFAGQLSPADAIAQKFAEQSPPPAAIAAKTQAAPTVPAKADRPPIDYEMEMLRRARAEQAEAKAAKPATPPVPAPPVTAAVAAPVTTPIVPGAATTTAPAQPAVAAPAKAAEVTPAPQPTAEVQAKAESKPVETARAPETTGAPAPRATLLLALESSGASTKNGPTPAFDPVICLGDSCFISAGLTADAVKLSKLDALKLKTTSEASPDSCADKAGCVFRNIAVPAGAQVQVIEMGSASRDPVHTSDVQLDQSCKMSDGDLNCDNPILTKDFKIWVVPEETARSAGAQKIEDALADELPHEDVARATDK